MFKKLSVMAVIAALAAVFVFQAGEAASAKDDYKNAPVILISLDTTRKDAVSLYGLGNGQTPYIDAFSKDCVVFNNAFSNIPHTLPSHISMITGLYPLAHRVMGRKQSLSPKVETLAEYLKGTGYKTAGVYSFWWLNPDYGFGRGFDSWKNCEYGLNQAPRVNKLAMESLDKLPKDKFFLFLHYYDAHSDFIKGQKLPYIAPPNLIKKYSQGYEGSFQGGDVSNESYASPFLVKVNKDANLRKSFPAQDLMYIKALYAAGVEYMDAGVGAMLKSLKDKGIYDKALIIVVADHGEEFMDHNMFLHEQVYDELLRVPLMVKLPNSKNAGRRVDDLVEIVDILPTILQFAGAKPNDYVEGTSFLGLADGTGRKQAKQYVFMRHPHKRNILALRSKTDKIIVDGNKATYYNVARDPGEKIPIKNSKVVPKKIIDDFVAIKKYNDQLAARLGQGTVVPKISKEEEERLKSLGYLH